MDNGKNNKGYSIVPDEDVTFTYGAKGKPAAAAQKKKGGKKATVVAIVLVVVAILCCLGYIGLVLFQYFTAEQSYGEINEIALIGSDSQGEGEELVTQANGTIVQDDNSGALGQSPIDLPALQEINEDVYAWLRIPGTYVDYPVAQSVKEDNYYLHRSIYKNYLFAGMIYTQSCNSRDFSDPVTVIYGHNMRNGTMFSSLHYFEKADFFEEHDVFYIYTVDRVLTYHIIAAYKYDNRHIMNAFDFSDPEVLKSYQEFVLDPVSTLRNVREGVILNEDSKLVVLSTCAGNDKGSRYLVTGVLVNDVPIEQ